MKSIAFEERILVPIIGDGAIASHSTADGRTIPVLILNCDNHKEFLNLIYLHESSPPGDVTCNWVVKRFAPNFVFLILEFHRPLTLRVGLQFDLSRQGELADGIVQSCGVYLQPVESGKKVSEGIDKPKILVEVNPVTKLRNWDDILLKAIRKRIRRGGLSRNQATTTSEEFLKRSREIWGYRMDRA